jgi:3-oxoacyl-[acyl-carrier protein] reductase
MFSYQSAKAQADTLVKACGEANCAAVACDLAGLEAAKALVDQTVAKFGRLDILVANHGIWPARDAGVDVMSDAQWRGTVSVNLDSVFSLIRSSVAQMKKQRTLSTGKGGHIVLISSTAGQRGEAFHVDYAATKGALISMVKGLSTELAPDGIYVNCVAPGWVATDMSLPALNDPKTGETIRATIPMGRVGTPEEIAAPILFLCTEQAGFITGEILNVNGGAVLVG